MSIEDIDFLRKNSTKESVVFIIDSKMRDYLKFPDPNYYNIKFNKIINEDYFRNN